MSIHTDTEHMFRRAAKAAPADQFGPIHFVAATMIFLPFWLFPLMAWIV